MNRTDRLLAIVLELQGKHWQRAEDLAATFETSKRTIYRDIEALCEAGVPVVAVPGRGYALVEGFFLPPVRFTTDEATVLLLGTDVMAQNFDAQYREAALSASRKVEAVLPEALREDVRLLQGSLSFISGEALAGSVISEMLQVLRRAVIERRSVRFRYYNRHRSDEQATPTVREADPYALAHVISAWYLQAYSHERSGLRHFRLDRMSDLELLETTFVRPALTLRKEPLEGRNLVIRVLFDNSVARWVEESRYFYLVAQEQRGDGLEATLRVRREEDALQWILSWGRNARVLEPESLRVRLAAEIEAMGLMYEKAMGYEQ